MVRRASSAPRTLREKIAAQDRATSEVARAAGRPATVLRDSAGNQLRMNPDAPSPLLTASGADSAMAFDAAGAVKIVSPDTLEDRDLTARGIQASGPSFVQDHLGVVGQIEADTIGTKTLGVGTVNGAQVNTGRTHMDDAGILTPGIGVGGLGDFGRITTPDLGANHVGVGVGNFGDLSYVRLVAPPSERELKETDPAGDVDPDEALAAVRRWVAGRWRWIDPPTTGTGLDDGLHVGLYVDEVDDTAPEIVSDLGGARSYSDRGVLAYLTAAVQRIADQRDELADRVAALERDRR